MLARYYNPNGLPMDTNLGNLETEGVNRDARGRVASVDAYPTSAYDWNTQRLDETFTYFPDSTPATATDQLGSAAQAYSYSYNALNQISQWSNGAGLTRAFWVDRYGNMTDGSGNASCGLRQRQSGFQQRGA